MGRRGEADRLSTADTAPHDRATTTEAARCRKPGPRRRSRRTSSAAARSSPRRSTRSGCGVHPKTIIGDAKARVASTVDQTAGRAYVAAVNRARHGCAGPVACARTGRRGWSGSCRSRCVVVGRGRPADAARLCGARRRRARDGSGRPGAARGTGRARRTGTVQGVSAKNNTAPTTSCPSGCCTTACSCGPTSREGERRSGGGILIPATAAVGRRLAWAEVVAVGQNVRTVEPGTGCCTTPRTGPRSRCAGSRTC